MENVPAKFREVVDEGVARLLSRAERPRGLGGEQVRPRIEMALGKYVFRESPHADRAAVREFIDEIRADELCLIIACELGDEDAWADLVRDFDLTVRSAAKRITSNAEDAEDLAGSIWAELYGLRQDAEGNKKSKLAYYSGRGSLGGWLRAVVTQLAVDEHRKQSRLVQIEEDREFENLAADAGLTDNGLVSHTDDPELLITDKRTEADVTAALRAAIAGIADEDRLVLKLYYFDDLKLKDIAATFGYHEATASRKLVRIQSDIRSSVEKELKRNHGWTDTEVKRYLADAAAKLGLSLEEMLAVVLFTLMVQESALMGVL